MRLVIALLTLVTGHVVLHATLSAAAAGVATPLVAVGGLAAWSCHRALRWRGRRTADRGGNDR